MTQSESEEDLGGFDPTTPLVSRKLPPSTTNTAGPSRTVTKGKVGNTPVSIHSDDEDIQEVPKVQVNKRATRAAGTGRRRRKQDADKEEADDGQSEHTTKKKRTQRDEEIEEQSSVEEVQEVPPPAAKKVRASSRRPASRSGKSEVTVNGTARLAKRTGKLKAKAAVVDDDDESLEIEEDDARMEVENLANAINTALISGKRANARSKQASSAADKGTDDECARVREQLRRAQEHIEDLKRHIEELHHVRMTEPEVLLQRMEAQHRKEQQGSEALIIDLREQLARKDPLLRTNKNTAFELLTREEANKESQGLRDQVKTYQDAIRERDQILKDKDEEIGVLKTSVNDLRYELQAEIERSKNLSSQRPPDSASRARRGRVLSPNEDPKMAEVVRFYEDLTNLLVTDIKPQPAQYLQFEDWLLTCVYSYRDVVAQGSPSAKSLSFRLRLCYEPKPNLQGEPKGKNDLAESLQYTPLELEKETEEFVKSLGFLNNSFTFEREQLALFLRTLHDVVSGDGNGNESDGSDSGIRPIG